VTVTAWDRLGDRALLLGDGTAAPPLAGPGLCRTCLRPVQPGALRCLPCALHRECAPGPLASAVLPVAYAVKGSRHARRLWTYKSAGLARAGPAGTAPAAGAPGPPEAGAAEQEEARRALTVLLLVFLREHGACLARAAGWTGPTHLAVVPSGRGRPGPHPLLALVRPYLRLPWARLMAHPAALSRDRDLDPLRFTAPRLDGARVLLLDDTWTTGASVQSAALALRGAGASAVAAVVLGRHLGRDAAGAGVPFTPGHCALHRPAA
jgi:hypothetical protein